MGAAAYLGGFVTCGVVALLLDSWLEVQSLHCVVKATGLVVRVGARHDVGLKCSRVRVKDCIAQNSRICERVGSDGQTAVRNCKDVWPASACERQVSIVPQDNL